MGSVCFGQPRRVVVLMNIPPAAAAAGYLKATVRYAHRGTGKGDASSYGTREVMGRGEQVVPTEVLPEQIRLQMCDALRMVMEVPRVSDAEKKAGKEMILDDANEIIRDLVADIMDDSPVAGEEQVQ